MKKMSSRKELVLEFTLIEVGNFFGHLDKSTIEAESFAHWFSKYGFDGGA